MQMSLHPDGELQLSADSTTETFRPITDWCSTLEALSFVVGLLFVAYKAGTFQCRLGIQACVSEDAPAAPVAIGTDSALITAAGVGSGKVYRFDPNATGNGDIDSGAVKFRLGILYSCSSAATGSGLVRWQGLSWR